MTKEENRQKYIEDFVKRAKDLHNENVKNLPSGGSIRIAEVAPVYDNLVGFIAGEMYDIWYVL